MPGQGEGVETEGEPVVVEVDLAEEEECLLNRSKYEYGQLVTPCDYCLMGSMSGETTNGCILLSLQSPGFIPLSLLKNNVMRITLYTCFSWIRAFSYIRFLGFAEDCNKIDQLIQ